ncbi:hypothetical protein [Curtobacterium sp. UNCCL17]|nr:hypothetical protein [Curtobacterium sp. UNCCL17]
MTDHDDLVTRVLDDLKRDEKQRQDGEKPDPTTDLDDFARRAFGTN